MTQEAPKTRPLVLLPNGVVLNLDEVLFIARKEIGQYIVFMKNSTAGPSIGAVELDLMEEYGIIQRLVPITREPKLTIS